MATGIDQFAAQLVPGLFQTAAYARAIFRAHRPHASDEQIQKLIDARLSRAAILEKPEPPVLWLVMDEAVLRRQVGGFAAMEEQLSHLVQLVRSRALVAQVIPFEKGAHAALEGPLTLLEFNDQPPVAYTESQGSSRLLEAGEDVRKRRVTYDLIPLRRAAAGGIAQLHRKRCEGLQVMITTPLTWHKSSYSDGGGGNCVEVAAGLPGVVPVRDSKDPEPVVLFPAHSWATFVDAVKGDAIA